MAFFLFILPSETFSDIISKLAAGQRLIPGRRGVIINMGHCTLIIKAESVAMVKAIIITTTEN